MNLEQNEKIRLLCNIKICKDERRIYMVQEIGSYLNLLSNPYTPVIFLLMILIALAIFKSDIRYLSITSRLGIFSIIISLFGQILRHYVLIGFFIQVIGWVCFFTIILIKIYKFLFGKMDNLISKIWILSFSIFILFTIFSYSNELSILEQTILNLINKGKLYSLFFLSACSLVKFFQLIFFPLNKCENESEN